MKTNKCVISLDNFWNIEKQACNELTYTWYVKDSYGEYGCDRSGQSYCYGTGWCPLRYKYSWCTPRMRLDNSGWRHY